MAVGQQDNAQRPANGEGDINANAQNRLASTSAANANTGEEVWDEHQLEKAMNTLKEMHIQVAYSLKVHIYSTTNIK